MKSRHSFFLSKAKNLFKRNAEKISDQQPISTSKIDIFKQHQLMEADHTLLSPEQKRYLKKLVKNQDHPVFIQKSLKFPYHVVHDGSRTYVLSDILLGKGGEGCVIAAQQFLQDDFVGWVAIKEGLGESTLYEMNNDFIKDVNSFLDQYRDTLLYMYAKKFPCSEEIGTEIDEDGLIKFFKEIIIDLKQNFYAKAKAEATTAEAIKNIQINVFATDNLVYQVMPLIRGHDLLLITNPNSKEDFAAVFNLIEKDADIDLDMARDKWGPLLLNFASIIEQMVGEIQNLHEKNYLHRDLKPNNFMLSTLGKVSLIDFGTAVKMTNNMFIGHYAVGTPHYRSPALIEHQEMHPEKNYQFTVADDLYSLGLTLNELMCQSFGKALLKMYSHLEHIMEQSLHALNALTDCNAPMRLEAMAILTTQLKDLKAILEIENGLTLQHDEEIEVLTNKIESYRDLLKDEPARFCKPKLIIDGAEIIGNQVQTCLHNSFDSKVIAKNLVHIKLAYLNHNQSLLNIDLVQPSGSVFRK